MSTTVVTLRLLYRDGRIDDALAVDDRTMHAPVVVMDGVTFVHVGADNKITKDNKTGKWLKLYRETEVVVLRAIRTPTEEPNGGTGAGEGGQADQA